LAILIISFERRLSCLRFFNDINSFSC
jgi:hypothetical protein